MSGKTDEETDIRTGVIEHSHEHIHGDGVPAHTDGGTHEHVHTHADGTTHSHKHTHSHTQTKAVQNRLARAAGHLEKVRRMVDEGEDCAAVLMQLAAVKAALNNTAKIILQDHIEHCVVDAAESGDMDVITDLNKAIQRFME